MSEEVTNLPDLSDSDLRACYPEVEAFAVRMRAELLANSGKGDQDGWRTMSLREAWGEIAWHNAKMASAIKAKDWPLVRELAADVANGAMMLDDLVRISLGEPQPMLRAVALERSTTETRELQAEAFERGKRDVLRTAVPLRDLVDYGNPYTNDKNDFDLTTETRELLREIRDAAAPDDGSATDALNRVDAILDREGVLGPRRKRRSPVVSDVAEDTPKPLDPKPYSDHGVGVNHAWGRLCGECCVLKPRPQFEQDPARYGVTPTPEVSTGIEPVQFPPVPYPSTEEP